MKLENQVVSLELAKRLKELGVKQESYFYWGDTGSEYVLGRHAVHGGIIDLSEGSLLSLETYAAFTVAELGEMLPTSTTFKARDYPMWYVSHGQHQEEGHTEADARAKMLIYLLENKLLTL